MEKIYDVVIIGGGPAGLAAGLYGARGKMKTLIIEKGQMGGQIATTMDVENYPGAPEGVTGPSLIARMEEQVKHFGAEFVKDVVNTIDVSNQVKVVKCQGGDYHAKTVILATGAKPKSLGAPGERELVGKGVSYCATCDADFFTDLDVAVIGGGDSAVEEAIFLTKFAEKVTIIHRRDEFKAAKSIQEKAFKNPKINVVWDTGIESVNGDGIVESLTLKNLKTGEVSTLEVNGVFVFVGYTPITDYVKGIVDMDQYGYIIANDKMETSVPGIYVAGDLRQKTLRQVITACADGAIASTQAEKYIEEHFHE